MPKFCVSGDYRPAIKAARSSAHCRDCYREQVLAQVELLRCEVTGVAPVTDAVTQADVEPGGVVLVDEAETNVAALVAGGTVKVLGKQPPAASAPAAGKRDVEAKAKG